MSGCDNKNKDCDDCQKTLKDHLRKCADYGKNPPLIQKCEELPGGCSLGKPDCCPAPPPACPEPCPPPPKCPPPTCTFTCPASDCGKADCPPAPKCCPPPPTKVQQCPPKKNDNSCEPKPLAMDKKGKC